MFSLHFICEPYYDVNKEQYYSNPVLKLTVLLCEDLVTEKLFGNLLISSPNII